MKRVNWLVDCGDIYPRDFCLCQVRSSSHPVRATVFPVRQMVLKFLDVPVDGVAQGKPAFFMMGGRVGEDGLRGCRQEALIRPVLLHVTGNPAASIVS